MDNAGDFVNMGGMQTIVSILQNVAGASNTSSPEDAPIIISGISESPPFSPDKHALELT